MYNSSTKENKRWYEYYAVDSEGHHLPFIIMEGDPKSLGSAQKNTEGALVYPVLTLLETQGRLPSYFEIPFYGLPLRNFLDIMHVTLETMPCVMEIGEDKLKELFLSAKDKINELPGIHPYTQKFLDASIYNISSVLMMANGYGKFGVHFTFDLMLDSHIQQNYPCLEVIIREIALEGDGLRLSNPLFKFRILNFLDFYRNIKHFDPRLKLSLEDIQKRKVNWDYDANKYIS